jgi:hypothetical protein
MPVYIKKYRGGNYFQSRIFIDKMTINRIPADGFPVFRFETEDHSTIGSYRGGDFDLAVSMLQPERSQHDKSVKDFFFGAERDFYYLVIIVIGSQTFSGIAQQSQISADYTYSQNKYEIRLTCKDMLIEWSKRCSTVALSSMNISNGEQLTFENYIYRHFSGLTADIVLVGMPEKTYVNRLRELYSNIQWCYAFGDYFNFITGKESISRWEAFKQLALGMGFNFEMHVRPGSETDNEPEFIFNIFFLQDLTSEAQVELSITEHKEITTAPKLEWLFLKARNFVLNEGQYANGILFNGSSTFQADTNNANNQLYPAFFLNLNDRVLNYVNQNQNTEKTVIRNIDFTELDLIQYYYDVSTGAPLGKLFPLNETLGGGMAYSRIFNCARVHGEIDLYDYIPIQQNTLLNYQRYIKGLRNGKNLVVALDENSNLKLWRAVKIVEENVEKKYYISTIRNIDLQNKTAEIEVINFQIL